MPAIERSFDEPPPDALYLDTDIIIAHVVANEPHHARTTRFVAELLRHGHTTLYTSTLSSLEFHHVAFRERFRLGLPIEMRRRLHLEFWDDRAVRDAYLAELRRAFETTLVDFRYVEIDLTREIRDSALGLIAHYGLGSQDAVHLASAQYAGVRDFASFDEGFRRVDGLILWNDLIHTQSQRGTRA